MTTYMTSAAGLPSMGHFASNRFVHNAGPVFAYNSYSFVSSVPFAKMERRLAFEYGAENVHRMSRDVVAFFTGRSHEVLQRVPALGQEPTFDFTQIALRGARANPILLFRPNHRTSDHAFRGWMESLARFGYDIRVVGKHREFREQLAELEPEIACVSAHEELVPHVGAAYRNLNAHRPEAISILGGYAALPAAANFFDIAVPGEGDLIFPLLLKYLLTTVVPEGKVAAPEAHRSYRPFEIPEWARYHLKNLWARRLLPGGNHGYREVSAAMIDVGARIYVAGARTPKPIDESMRGPTAAWPIPINGEELRTIWAMPPAGETPPKSVSLYAQRGCRSDPAKRCRICSISGPSGRRLAVKDVLQILGEYRDRGVQAVVMSDENFLGSRPWVERLLDGMELQGLPGGMKIFVQTRADMWAPDLVHRLWDMNFQLGIGLEAMNPARAERLGKAAQGKGERYVERGKELMRMGMSYCRDRGLDPSEVLKVFMIASGEGDTLEDMIEEALLQLEFFKELRGQGYDVPDMSFNIMQVAQASDRAASEKPGVQDAMRMIVLENVGEQLDRKGVAWHRRDGVILGFHPFALFDSGEAAGMMVPEAFDYDKPLADFVEHLWGIIYGESPPAEAPKPGNETFHAAFLVALEESVGALAEIYGSREDARSVVERFAELYDEAYPEDFGAHPEEFDPY